MKSNTVKTSLTVGVLSLASLITVSLLPAAAESQAAMYASSWSGGITSAGGESKSGGPAGTAARNEVEEKGLNSDSQSGGTTSRTETSVAEKNVLVDGYYRLQNPQPPVSNVTNLPARALPGTSASAQNPAKAAAAHTPQMVITTYEWGRRPAKQNAQHHSLASKSARQL
ncbi:MAG TPA: hypothetical protein V6C72_17255 [Chroococcales cyanobacterium]